MFNNDKEEAVPAEFDEAPVEDEVSAEFEYQSDDEPQRGKVKPESEQVTFTVHRPFKWDGTELVPGEYTWIEEDYNAMAYDINLRTDRVRFISRA